MIRSAIKYVIQVAQSHDPEYLNKDTTRLMDFGCGTGLGSQQLMPLVHEIVGIDIDQSNVDEFNKNMQTTSAHAQALDISEDAADEFQNSFDVVVCCLVLHHIKDYKQIVGRLCEFVKPGGILLVVELIRGHGGDTDPGIDPQGRDPDRIGRTVYHAHGIPIEELKQSIEDSGLEAQAHEPRKAYGWVNKGAATWATRTGRTRDDQEEIETEIYLVSGLKALIS